jgi:NAD(P)-dependent dehydrogenase (short-subunit alcohol dehydrogenase family)
MQAFQQPAGLSRRRILGNWDRWHWEGKRSLRIWFITGASRGLGAELVVAALAVGDAVVATARNPQSLTERFGEQPNLLPLRLDVTVEADAKAAIDAAMARYGRLDVLVNNAGYGLLGAIEESSAAEVERIYRTNVFGLLNVTRAALAVFRRQRSGHIINISSLGGYQATAAWGIYCSSKAAVEGISEALHRECAPLGIKVTIATPAFFRSDFLAGSSLVLTETKLDDYHATVGAARAYVSGVAADPDAGQVGCSVEKLAEAVRMVVDSDDPPLRLLLGQAALIRVAEKHANVDTDLANWRAVSEMVDQHI